MADELRRHADAGIGAAEDDLPAGQAVQPDGDLAAHRGVFDGVGDDVDHDLAVAVGIAHHHTVWLIAVQRHGLGLFVGQRAQQFHTVGRAAHRIKGSLVQLHVAVLQLVQVQNRVDEHQQVVALVGNAVQCAFQPRGVVLVLLGDLGHAQHHVQRRADVVAHLGEEFLLGLVGFFGIVQSVGQLQQDSLLLFSAADRLQIQQHQAAHQRQHRHKQDQVGGVVEQECEHCGGRHDLGIALHDLGGILGRDAVQRLFPQAVKAAVDLHVYAIA